MPADNDEMPDDGDQMPGDEDANADAVTSPRLEPVFHVALGPAHVRFFKHMLIIFRLFATEHGHNIGTLFGDSMTMSGLVELLYGITSTEFDVVSKDCFIKHDGD